MLTLHILWWLTIFTDDDLTVLVRVKLHVAWCGGWISGSGLTGIFSRPETMQQAACVTEAACVMVDSDAAWYHYQNMSVTLREVIRCRITLNYWPEYIFLCENTN